MKNDQAHKAHEEDALSVAQAKQNFVMNVVSNLAAILLSSIISVVLVSYLIKRLGVAAYGMVALANSFPGYIQLVMKSLSNSLVRFMSISASRGEMDNANIYFNTAFTVLAALGVFLLIPSAVFSWYLPYLFEIPEHVVVQTQCLVFVILVGSLVGAVSTPFRSILMIYHRFIEINVLTIVSRLVGIAFLVASFIFWGTSLIYVGLNQLIYLTLLMVGLFYFSQHFQDVFLLKRKTFQKTAMKEVGQLSVWVLLNDTSALLYFVAGVAVVNVALGAEASGYFGPIMLLVTLILQFAGALNNVLMPVFYSYVAQDDQELLSLKFYQAIRLFVSAIGISIVLLCGFAKSILYFWVGSDFVKYWPLLWMVLISLFFGGLIVYPAAHIYRGKNRMRLPASVNVCFGVVHLLLMVIFIRITDWGLMSFGVSFSITFGLRGIILNLAYSAHLIQQSVWKSLMHLLRPCVYVLIMMGVSFWVDGSVGSLWQLLLGVVAITVCYFLGILLFILPKEDLALVLSILKRKKEKSV